MGILITLQGPELGRTFSLDRDESILGRQHDSAICLAGRAVSRHHARIVRKDGAYVIEDLDSSNGTYLNGQRLTPLEPTPLTERDSLQIGPYVFALRMPAVKLRSEPDLVVRETVQLTQPGLFGPDAATKLQVVLEIAQHLARTLDIDELLDQVLDKVQQLFPQADRALVILCEDDQLVLRAQKARRPEADEWPFSRTIVRRALSEGVGLISDDVKRDERFNTSQTVTTLNLHSMMCAPMIGADGRRLGALQIDRYCRGLGFRLEDLQLLTAVTLQVAVALENASLHAQRLHEQRLHQEIALARDIQQDFLPDELDDFPHANFDIFGRVYPARQVAGDWYDFLRGPSGKLAFFVGDVSGKGMPAALFLVAVRTLCRHLAKDGQRPAQTLRILNRDLAADNPACMFVTLVHGLYDPSSGETQLTSAGHHPPLVRRADGTVAAVALRPGRLLGYEDAELTFDEARVTLNPGDMLVFFTDGVLEARAADGKDMFGVERLMAVVAEFTPRQSLSQCVELVKQRLDQFAGTKDLPDDVTLLLLRRR
jgi:serine phosphatase RsbU (regulator of sigma subunit)